MCDAFPSLKAQQLFRVLRHELGYEVVRRKGSHRTMTAQGRPRLIFAFHDQVSLPPGLVRTILVKQIGLSVDEALEVLRR